MPYIVATLVAISNILLMRRIRPYRRVAGKADTPNFCVLIPARNEEANLPTLLSVLQSDGVKVFVYDDESTDDTAEIAKQYGAKLVLTRLLPDGWTGKNWACHQLAQAAGEDFDGDWFLFLDADVRVAPGFGEGLSRFIRKRGAAVDVISGLPRVSGQGVFEPIMASWVSWLSMASNLFGVVARWGLGRNQFLDGRFMVWRGKTYLELMPHEGVRGLLAEDIAIGRLCARCKVRTEIVNLSQLASVDQGETGRSWRTLGCTASEIAGGVGGAVVLSIAMLGMAWGWPLLADQMLLGLGLLLASKLITDLIVKNPIWLFALAPVSITIGALNLLQSARVRKTGSIDWKGRRVQLEPGPEASD